MAPSKPAEIKLATSPRKNGGHRPTKKTVPPTGKQGAIPLTLTVYAFHETIGMEAYIFTKDDAHDGFIHGYKEYVASNIKNEILEKSNFTGWKNHRVPGTDNVIMVDPKGFWRAIMIRYLPGDGVSTPETRQSGLKVLSAFLQSKDGTKYAPKDVILVDATNVEDPHSLDHFFMDQDIVEFAKTEIAEDDLNGEFYSRFPEFARKLWAGKFYPDFARELGFPSTGIVLADAPTPLTETGIEAQNLVVQPVTPSD